MWGKLLLALTLYPPGIEFKVWWAGLALTLLLIIDCYFKFLFLTPSLPKSHPHSGEQVVRVVGGGAARGLRAVDSSPPPTLHSGAGLGAHTTQWDSRNSPVPLGSVAADSIWLYPLAPVAGLSLCLCCLYGMCVWGSPPEPPIPTGPRTQ